MDFDLFIKENKKKDIFLYVQDYNKKKMKH